MKDTGERLIAKGHEQSIIYAEHISRYMSVSNLIKGKVVLDVASGSGYGSYAMAAHAKSVTGLDYNKEAVQYARRQYKTKNLSFHVGDAQAMPFDDASFDVIISFETIEHLPNQEKFMKEVKRVLKPGGLFVVSTPNDDEFVEGNVFHVHELDLKGFKKLLTKYFKRHDFYYQSTYYAVSLGKAETISPAYDKPFRVHKAFAQPVEKSIYYLAVASDNAKALPELEPNIALGDLWTAKGDQEQELRQQRELQKLSSQLLQSQHNAEQLLKALNDIYSSKVWKLGTAARKVLHPMKNDHHQDKG